MIARHREAVALGPKALKTHNAWRECRLLAKRPKWDKKQKEWWYDCVMPNGDVKTFYFDTRAKAARTVAECVLRLMAREIGFHEMELYVLPRSYKEAWNRLAQLEGVIPAKKKGGKWTEAMKQRAAAKANRRWRKYREQQAAAILASLPPVSSLTELATVKLLVRLRRRFPHAPASALETLARMDAGTLL